MKEKTKRSQKRALFFSALAMVLSFTMLLGTTYAWFTDSVVSSGNRIQSGKLKVGLEYCVADNDGNFTEWKDAANVENILDPNALYEPGYVSMTLLRVENKGTLALKYQLAMVKEEAERSAINVKGNTFKLSDYLIFKFVKLDETTAVKRSEAEAGTKQFTRDDALALVGENAPMGLNAQTTVDAVLADSGSPKDYVALVITMPEGVGNDAMYDPDKSDPPQLSLDFKLVATQYAHETDSFDQYYDEKAYNADWNVYQYIKGDISKGLSAYDKDGDEQNRYAVVTVTGTQPNNVTLRVSECNAPVGLEIVAGTTYKSYDISVVDDNGNTPADTYTVKMFIGKDLPDAITLYHNKTEITEKTYDANTGYLTFTTDSFSPFTAVVAGVAAKVGDTWYTDVPSAFAAAKNADDKTVVLTAKENALDTTLQVNAGEEVVLDLNGCTLKTTARPTLQNAGTLTFKDDSAKANGAVVDEGKFDIEREDVNQYGDYRYISSTGVLNIEGGTIEFIGAGGNGPLAAVYNNGGELNISGGKVVTQFTKNPGGYNTDVYSVYSNGGTFNMSDGEISASTTAHKVYALNLGGATTFNITGGTMSASGATTSEMAGLLISGSAQGTVANATITADASNSQSKGVIVNTTETAQLNNLNVSASTALFEKAGTVEVKGGKYDATYICVDNSAGKMSVDGATLNVENKAAVYPSTAHNGANGEMQLKNCDINGAFDCATSSRAGAGVHNEGMKLEVTDCDINVACTVGGAYGIKNSRYNASTAIQKISGCNINVNGVMVCYGISNDTNSTIGLIENCNISVTSATQQVVGISNASENDETTVTVGAGMHITLTTGMDWYGAAAPMKTNYTLTTGEKPSPESKKFSYEWSN